MTEMKLDLGDMEAVVSAQVLASISDEVREKILSDAVKMLITAQQRKDRYDRPIETPSMIHEAFNAAVRGLAQKIAVELIEENPEVERRVREAAGEAIIVWMEDDGNLMGSLAEAIVETFRKKLQVRYDG